MHDVAELLIRPIASALLFVVRGLLWIGWELCFQTVGWAVGWLVCRLVSAGRFPAEGLGALEQVHEGKAFAVECIGLGCLFFLAWALSRYLGA